MNEGLIPARYAKALYKFAVENKIEGELYTAMHNITIVLESPQGHEFRNTVANPFVSEVDKRKLIAAGAGIDEATTPVASALNDFMSLLFKNNRVDCLPAIAYAYDTIYRKEKAISRVHVTWAAQPQASSEEKIKNMIAQRLHGGSMEYSSSIDPQLIGGFKIAIDNEQLDASVENELRQLRQQLLSK